ncbi:MAG: hypothetical protein GY749_02835 [Desulfobacteraceae bacterium]|nr:hypothetical protein [Desulfobacteraceae bacterium]
MKSSPPGDLLLPLEKQGRPLVEKFRNDPDRQRHVWLATVKETWETGEPVTTKLVARFVRAAKSDSGGGTGKGKKTRKKETISFSKEFQRSVAEFVKAIDAEIVRGAKSESIVSKLKELEKYTKGRADEVA